MLCVRFHGDICKMMCLHGTSGLEQEIAEADDTMPPEGLPVASKWAGGESRPCLDSSERKHWAKVLFCAPIDSINESYKIPKPRTNAWVLK